MESMKMLKNQDFIKQINLNKMNIKNWLYPNTHGVKVDAVLLFLQAVNSAVIPKIKINFCIVYNFII